jgi:hypothetical protein
MDILTLLMNATIREIQEAEDQKFYESLNEMGWINSDKCKGNILRYARPFNTKRKVFLWFVNWAVTRSKHSVELHSSL